MTPKVHRHTSPAIKSAVVPAITTLAVQRMAASGESVNGIPAVVGDVINSPGQPLNEATRSFMEPRFGHDFSHVRVHSDAKATRSAQAVNALAYTIGKNIVFGPGNYEIATGSGKKLLAHELAHVVQQRNVSSEQTGKIKIEDRQSHLEREAETISSQVMNENRPHSLQEKASVQTLARQSPAVTCAKSYSKAATFQQFIDLIREAETKLKAAGVTSPKDQIHALRGVYYGTTWSRDFTGVPGHKGEGSAVRNEGFQLFTRPSEAPDKSIPLDVQGIFDCGLLDALKLSQDVIDPDGRQVDVGHLIIGLDARFDPAFSNNVTYPVMGMDIDMGGTGTQLVTWIGDLGGGAANLAILRVLKSPTTSVSVSFSGTDYGGPINLEGDVAGSVVASSSSTAVTMPSFAPGKGLSDALQDYLSPGAPGTAWKERAKTFLVMNGATFDAAGALTNRAGLISGFATKFQTFACNYLASRVKDNRITVAVGKSAAEHVIPASEEVAETFVDALDDSRKTGNNIAASRFPSPKSAKPGACTTQIMAAEMLKKAGDLLPW